MRQISVSKFENLNAIVAPVTNKHFVVGRDGNAQRKGKLTDSLTICAKRVYNDAVQTENLKPVVFKVTHNDVVIFIHSQTTRTTKLPSLIPRFPYCLDERTMLVEHFYDVISGIRYNKYLGIVVIDCKPWMEKFSFAFITKFEEKRAVGFKDLNAVVVPVRDDDSILTVDGHSTGTVKLTVTNALTAKFFYELAGFDIKYLQ